LERGQGAETCSAVDPIRCRHVWFTALPVSVLETAVTLPDGSAFLDRALQRRVRFPTVYRTFCRNMGRRGSSAVGRILVAAAARADSAAERLLVRILPDAGCGSHGTTSTGGPRRSSRRSSRHCAAH